MRLALETLAMRSAMAHLTNAQIDAATDIQARMRDADALAFGALNRQVHMTLYRPGGRERLLNQLYILFHSADR